MIDVDWLCLIIPLTLLVGMIYGFFISGSYWRNDCIKHDIARYHLQTGKWEWTVKEVKND